MSNKTIPLKCPSCGNSSNLTAKELQFGFEFKCQFCSTISILVINDQLYIPSPGEHVCVKCGRVSVPDARFCQCGASLTRKCSGCHKEIPILHEICDYCGLPHNSPPSKIVFFRKPQFIGYFQSMHISVDGMKGSEIRQGETITSYIPIGEHTIGVYVRNPGDLGRGISLVIFPSKVYRIEFCFGVIDVEIESYITDA